MTFTETRLPGVFVIEPDRFDDERGFFARFYSRQEFEARRLETRLAEYAVSFNRTKGTLRGLHYQVSPHEQAKLVRCAAGSAYDVVVDLRSAGDSYLHWISVELSGSSMRLLYLPPGVAHGFLTLQDDTEITYLISVPRVPESERGIRWDDPAVGVKWPLSPAVLSERDRSFPLLGQR